MYDQAKILENLQELRKEVESQEMRLDAVKEIVNDMIFNLTTESAVND